MILTLGSWPSCLSSPGSARSPAGARVYRYLIWRQHYRDSTATATDSQEMTRWLETLLISLLGGILRGAHQRNKFALAFCWRAFVIQWSGRTESV
jgi:tRNA U38,U39,U40 pseudouridine synthase TruA